MEWGSTKPGELFTGSKRWQAEVKGDRLSLWVDKAEHLKIEPVDGQPLEDCPKCGSGVLQLRGGQYGAFYGGCQPLLVVGRASDGSLGQS